jgi:hydroxymethylpyrimidine/phosphomethylpyrimidine kinase
MKHNPSVCLSVAGSDSGAGAGIQADLKTMSALGTYGTSVIVALTAQNTLGVDAVLVVPPDFIEKQFTSVVSDFEVKAMKTGMLPNVETIKVVADCIRSANIKNYVLDPVMVATSGDNLALEETAAAIVKYLFPLAAIITPNIPEAETLLNRKISNENEMIRAANDLCDIGANAVLLKGGHLQDMNEIADVFLSKNDLNPILHRKRYVQTQNTHGTGCTLSSAVASFLADGEILPAAVAKAEEYMEEVISQSSAIKVGHGHGPLWHFI